MFSVNHVASKFISPVNAEYMTHSIFFRQQCQCNIPLQGASLLQSLVSKHKPFFPIKIVLYHVDMSASVQFDGLSCQKCGMFADSIPSSCKPRTNYFPAHLDYSTFINFLLWYFIIRADVKVWADKVFILCFA